MSKKVYSTLEQNLVQQPLDKSGYSSDKFDKLYGKDKNPYLGSERDRVNRKGTKMVSIPEPADWLKNAKPWGFKKNGNKQGTTKRVEKSKLGK